MEGRTGARSDVVNEEAACGTAVVRTRDGTKGFRSCGIPACMADE